MRRDQVVIAFVLLTCVVVPVPSAASAQTTAVSTDELRWELSDAPGFPEGAERKLLRSDPATGIGSALRRHPKGYTEPRHYHTTAGHSIYIIEGRMTVGDVEAGPGDFFHFPSYTAHGPLTSLDDTVFLIWAEGPLDVVFGDPPEDVEQQESGALDRDLAADEAAVLAVVDSSLAAISAEDFEAFADLMLPEAIAFPVWEQPDGLAYRARTVEVQRSLAADDADLVERGFDAEVRVQGHLASVWLPYDFYENGQWSHCGVDAFILLRRPEGWRIASIAWTVEQPPACRAHPDGAPGG